MSRLDEVHHTASGARLAKGTSHGNVGVHGRTNVVLQRWVELLHMGASGVGLSQSSTGCRSWEGASSVRGDGVDRRIANNRRW